MEEFETPPSKRLRSDASAADWMSEDLANNVDIIKTEKTETPPVTPQVEGSDLAPQIVPDQSEDDLDGKSLSNRPDGAELPPLNHLPDDVKLASDTTVDSGSLDLNNLSDETLQKMQKTEDIAHDAERRLDLPMDTMTWQSSGSDGITQERDQRPLPGTLSVIASGSTSLMDIDENMEQNDQTAAAEFELDSSPIESSSDDSDSSSDDSSDDEYKMLDPAEQARRLMQEDGGSDDEGGKKGAPSEPLRTLNEKPDEIVEKPNINVTEDMKVEELGEVETLVDNLILVKAKTSGEYQVLETGSLLCLENRTVIGVVAETLGRVQQPLYTVRFTNSLAISENGISKGSHIYYVPQHSTYVFTQALKAMKGSDASNIHDEEVGDDELEFSDDEAEAEYKRNLKLQRQAKRGGREASTHGSSSSSRRNNTSNGRRVESGGIKVEGNVSIKVEGKDSLNYDDNAGRDDEHYTPLARPSSIPEYPPFADGLRNSHHPNSGGRGANNRGGFNRGRGHRGRGRGRERGGDRFGSNSGGQLQSFSPVSRTGSSSLPPKPDLSLPPVPQPAQPSYPMGPPQPPFPPPFPAYSPQQVPTYGQQGPSYAPYQPQYPYHQAQNPPTYTPQVPTMNNYPVDTQHRSPQTHYPQQQNPPQNHYSQHQYPPANPYHAGQPPHVHPAPPLPPGAFVNPAFFGNSYQRPPDQSHHYPQSQPNKYPTT
jgi:H/ACA ribonucleoprotein complex non-core subunit NAF1